MSNIHFRTHCGYDIVGDTLVLKKVEDKHLNAGGIVHGGLIATMLDHIGGMHVHSDKTKKSWVTISLNVNYLSSGLKDDTLTTTSEIIRAGKSVAVIDCKIVNQNDKLIATATATYKAIIKK